MKVLALCGSLRAQSLSAALLRATQRLASEQVSVEIFPLIGSLPLFNPDLEASAPQAVQDFWEAVTQADVVLIASPEYAHGVTAVIKNALDWLVGHIPFADKPVAVFNPSFKSHHADDAIKEILRTMSADLIADACVRIAVIGANLDEDGIVASAEMSGVIQAALAAMVTHVDRKRSCG